MDEINEKLPLLVIVVGLLCCLNDFLSMVFLMALIFLPGFARESKKKDDSEVFL